MVSAVWHFLPRLVGVVWLLLVIPFPHDIAGALELISCIHSMPAEEGKIDLSKVLDYYCV